MSYGYTCDMVIVVRITPPPPLIREGQCKKGYIRCVSIVTCDTRV